MEKEVACSTICQQRTQPGRFQYTRHEGEYSSQLLVSNASWSLLEFPSYLPWQTFAFDLRTQSSHTFTIMTAKSNTRLILRRAAYHAVAHVMSLYHQVGKQPSIDRTSENPITRHHATGVYRRNMTAPKTIVSGTTASYYSVALTLIRFPSRYSTPMTLCTTHWYYTISKITIVKYKNKNKNRCHQVITPETPGLMGKQKYDYLRVVKSAYILLRRR